MNDSELNAQIAERVMGWKITDKRPLDITTWRDYPDIWYSLPDGSLENILSIPYYANDIAAAWQVSCPNPRFGWRNGRRGRTSGIEPLSNDSLDFTCSDESTPWYKKQIRLLTKGYDHFREVNMNIVTMCEAKRDRDALVDKVFSDGEPAIITTDSGQQIVLLSLDEFNAWRETAYLLSNPANAACLRKSIAEAEVGNVVEHELTEL